jgi:dolichol kinase
MESSTVGEGLPIEGSLVNYVYRLVAYYLFWISVGVSMGAIGLLVRALL